MSREENEKVEALNAKDEVRESLFNKSVLIEQESVIITLRKDNNFLKEKIAVLEKEFASLQKLNSAMKIEICDDNETIKELQSELSTALQEAKDNKRAYKVQLEKTRGLEKKCSGNRVVIEELQAELAEEKAGRALLAKVTDANRDLEAKLSAALALLEELKDCECEEGDGEVYDHKEENEDCPINNIEKLKESCAPLLELSRLEKDVIEAGFKMDKARMATPYDDSMYHSYLYQFSEKLAALGKARGRDCRECKGTKKMQILGGEIIDCNCVRGRESGNAD